MTDIESRHLRDDKMNRCPGRVGPFFWGVLAMAGLAVVLFFVDDIYFEGEYLTQKKKVHELQNRLAKANYDMAEQQSFIEKVTSILGIVVMCMLQTCPHLLRLCVFFNHQVHFAMFATGMDLVWEN